MPGYSISGYLVSILCFRQRNTTKVIKYIAIESGEALTVVRGTGKTRSGETVIELPQHFSLVTSDACDLTVNLTPEGKPVTLYVKEKSRERLVVGMKKSDYYELGDADFSYRVTGVRDAFEDREVIVDVDEGDSEKTVRGRKGLNNNRGESSGQKMPDKRKKYRKRVDRIQRIMDRKDKNEDSEPEKDSVR